VNLPDTTPYATLEYAATCVHTGTPLALPRAGASLLVRPVAAGSSERDACAPYPLLACRDWAGLPADLDALSGLVSVTAVIDPLAIVDDDVLRRCFPDVLRRYKAHHCAHIDAASPLRHVRSSHRRKADAARAALHVEIHEPPVPADVADAWCDLYRGLGARHTLSEPSRFAPASLVAQLGLLGSFIVVAREGTDVVAAAVWFVGGTRAHYHLGASSPRGYEHSASFGVFAVAIEHLAGLGVELIDFGGAADGSATDGLGRFKRGWADHHRDAYVAGRVIDRDAFDALGGDHHRSGFFPPYRDQSRSNSRE
jgi:hypothetical protein